MAFHTCCNFIWAFIWLTDRRLYFCSRELVEILSLIVVPLRHLIIWFWTSWIDLRSAHWGSELVLRLLSWYLRGIFWFLKKDFVINISLDRKYSNKLCKTSFDISFQKLQFFIRENEELITCFELFLKACKREKKLRRCMQLLRK